MPEAPVGTDPASEPVPRAAASAAVLRQRHEPHLSLLEDGTTDAAAPAVSSLKLGRKLLAAIARLEGSDVKAILDRSLIALGLHRTVEEVLLPCMREVGTRWSSGLCNSEEEQLATTTVLCWLRRRVREAPPPLDERSVVLACGPLDGHTIALEAFHALLSHARFDCLNLGEQVSPATLVRAVDTPSAQAVVLVSHLSQNRATAVAALHAVEHSSATLFYAGAAFRTAASRRGVPGHYLGGNLGDAAAHLRIQLRVPRCEPPEVA